MLLPEDRYGFSSKRARKSSGNKKLIIILAAAVIIAGVLAAVFVPKRVRSGGESTVSHVEAVYEYWNVGKYDKVIEICEQQLVISPVNRQMLALCGFAYFYTALGEFSMEQKLAAIDKSIIHLRKLLVLGNNPYQAQTDYILGKAYFHKGKYYIDQSIYYLQRSVENGHESEDTFEYLGLAYSEIHQYEQSIEYFLKAAEQKETPVLYLTIAQTYYKMNDKKSSEEYLLRTINSTNDTGLEEKCRFLLAQIYLDSENYMKAIDQYERVISNNPDAADAHYQLGVIYEIMNDSVKARAEWRKTLIIDPSHYGARLKYYN